MNHKETNSSINIDLDSPDFSRIHIIGIGGAGMSAIATVLSKIGKQISGSDLKQSLVTERLETSGITVQIPHEKNVISNDIDLVVRSTAIADNNVEVQQAIALGVPVVARSAMLAAICAHENSIGVAGSHGKTTTTSMGTDVGREAGMKPSFMIGGDVNEIGTNAGYTNGSIMVVEADESDRTFLTLPLIGGIITNIENDHLESYNDSFEELKDSFYEYVMGVDGPMVICVDEKNARDVAERAAQSREIITVGTENADWTYEVNSASRGGINARVFHRGEPRSELALAVPGAHNIRNAMCAYALMSAFGVDDESAVKGLASFGGVARRFQFHGQTRGITFVDDYAHLPSEISATLNAAKDGAFGRVISIFQPHRYSRTQSLYKEFAESLLPSDIVGICNVYSAGEEVRPGINGSMISDEMKKLDHDNVHFLSHIDDVVSFVEKNGQPGDLV